MSRITNERAEEIGRRIHAVPAHTALRMELASFKIFAADLLLDRADDKAENERLNGWREKASAAMQEYQARIASLEAERDELKNNLDKIKKERTLDLNIEVPAPGLDSAKIEKIVQDALLYHLPHPRLRSYWCSWSTRETHELHYPWWVSGTILRNNSEDATIYCAAVRAESEHDARAIIRTAYVAPPRFLEWRFVDECTDDWSPYSDRFPRADWMPDWPPPDPDATPPA